MSRINVVEASHVPGQKELAFTDYAGNRPRASFMEQSLVRHKVIPAIPHDSAKTLDTKGIETPLQVPV